MNILLVVTTGQTDVQLVTSNVRREFHKDKCSELHCALEQRAEDWRIVDAPALKEPPEVTDLPEGSFEICTPKLDAVLALLDSQGLTVTHALVLDTERYPKFEKKDPRMAGRILERRLRERGRLPGSSIRRLPFLSGNDRLEDKSNPRDAVIRRDVVARIDGAVARSVTETAPQRIIVATTGAMSVVCTLVEEIVRLHAGVGVLVDPVEVADGAKASPPAADQAVARRWATEPAASYQARRHALEFIAQGSLIAAWGAVRHLHDDEVERRWTRVVEWLYCFAASLPLAEECEIEMLRHPRMAVRAALRVELALRAEDIPRAVHGTVAFFEAALWDHLGKHIERHPENHRLYKVEPPPSPDDNLVRTSDGTAEDRHRPFYPAEEVDGVRWYRIFDDDVCGIRLAKHYLNLDELTNLGQAVSKVRQLRNDVAHNEPTPELMDGARRRMVDAQLWSKEGRFLVQLLTQNVLRDLGEQQPGALCDDLIATVRRRLVAGT